MLSSETCCRNSRGPVAEPDFGCVASSITIRLRPPQPHTAAARQQPPEPSQPGDWSGGWGRGRGAVLHTGSGTLDGHYCRCGTAQAAAPRAVVKLGPFLSGARLNNQAEHTERNCCGRCGLLIRQNSTRHRGGPGEASLPTHNTEPDIARRPAARSDRKKHRPLKTKNA